METRVLSHDGGRVRFVSLNQQLTEDLLIESWPCVMGSRQEDTQLTIPMIGISRRHALLEKEEDGVYLSDLHSTNGTYVNHVRLKDGEKRLLLVEDIVQLADIQYMYCGTG